MAQPKYKYRYKKQYARRGKSNDWQPCTISDKEKLERMCPGKFEFIENTPPKPTPSMEDKDK